MHTTKRKVLDLSTYEELRDYDHIRLYITGRDTPIEVGSVQKAELSESIGNNEVVIVLNVPDDTCFCITAFSVRKGIYSFERGKLL